MIQWSDQKNIWALYKTKELEKQKNAISKVKMIKE
jgi:hypothetical protein